VSDAILGGLVIAVIANGLRLITEQAGIQFVVTGLVLLVAASVDAISRKRATAS
jgi:D-xylose transport system permease protein